MQFSSFCRMWVRLSPPSRKRQGGVKRVPQALQACILTVTCFTSTRLPGRTEARPYRKNDILWLYYAENKVGSRLGATYQAMVSSPRHLGRAEARQIGANENPQRVEDTLWIECVGDAPVVVSPALSIGDA